MYLIGEYAIKWRPWGKFSNLPDQIKHWTERVEECFKGLENIQDMLSDKDKTKLKNFMSICGFSYKNKDIRSSLRSLEKFSEFNELKNNKALLNELKGQFEGLSTKYKEAPLERLVLKIRIVQYCNNDNLSNNLLSFMFDDDNNEEVELVFLYLRYFTMDFIIDYQRTFCNYYSVQFFTLHHDETTNFNIKHSLRDLEAQKRKKLKRDAVGSFLMSAFKGMIPFMKRSEIDIEKIKTIEQSQYAEPKTVIDEVNVEYLSKLYKDNLTNLLGTDRGSDKITIKKQELTENIFKTILIEIAKADQDINYKIMTDYLQYNKDVIKQTFLPLSEYYKNERENLKYDRCLENGSDINTLSEDELIAQIDFKQYQFRIEKDVKDKKHYLFKDLHSQIGEYEKVINSIESSFGSGLLSIHYDKLMQWYHTLIYLEHYQSNKGKIDEIVDYEEEDKNKYYEVIRSLQELNLLISNDFPLLQYYDMNRECNIERKMLYYLDIFDRNGAYLATIFEMLLYGYEFYKNSKYNRHKKLRSGLVNALIDWIYSVRRSMHDIAKKPGNFIIKNFEWAMEGFKEQYEHFSNEQKKKEDVIEHFGAIKKIVRMFKSILDFINVLLSIVKIITDPIKIIKIMLMAAFSFIVIFVSFIELFTNIVTGTFLNIVLVLVIIIYSYFYVSYQVGLLIFSFLEIYVFSLNSSKSHLAYWLYNITASENDIRNWYTVAGFDQGNQVDYTVIGHSAPCSADYEKEMFYCKKNPDYLPTFSHQANVYKIVNGLSTSGRMNMMPIPKSSNFMNQTPARKKRIIKNTNRTKRIFFKKSETYFGKHENVNRFIKTLCSNPDQFDLSSSEKQTLQHQCGELFCKNGSTMSSCVSVPNIDLDISSTLKFELKKIGRYLNTLFSILLIIIIIAFLTYK